jgi:hypothetical protein
VHIAVVHLFSLPHTLEEKKKKKKKKNMTPQVAPLTRSAAAAEPGPLTPAQLLAELHAALGASAWDPSLNRVARALTELHPARGPDAFSPRGGWVLMPDRVLPTCERETAADVARTEAPTARGVLHVLWCGMGGSAEVGKLIGTMCEETETGGGL